MPYFPYGGIFENCTRIGDWEMLQLCYDKRAVWYYNQDNNLVALELQTFIMCTKSHTDIYISDILHSSEAERMEITEDEVQSPAGAEDPDDSENESEKQRTMDQWIMRGFIRTSRCVLNLPVIPNLTMMYRILFSLAVTSCSQNDEPFENI
ncbi:hypothetical protein PR048_026498 [Dryococelus australis]|uniref:Uncharacterized protein n=1 Tax=Dryococelus australis TaxID=614101 RepID=A0ABQ9GLH1_9NEOP|nr:hypothetical protein PR048_026498 [Dryococelus australis]